MTPGGGNPNTTEVCRTHSTGGGHSEQRARKSEESREHRKRQAASEPKELLPPSGGPLRALLAQAGGRPHTKHRARNMKRAQPRDGKIGGRRMPQQTAFARTGHMNPMNACAPAVSDSERPCATAYQASQNIRVARVSSQSKRAAMVVRVRPGPQKLMLMLLCCGKTPNCKQTRKTCHAETRLLMEALLPYAKVANAQPRPSSRNANGASDAPAEKRPTIGMARLLKAFGMLLSVSRHLGTRLTLEKTRHAAALRSPP